MQSTHNGKQQNCKSVFALFLAQFANKIQFAGVCVQIHTIRHSLDIGQCDESFFLQRRPNNSTKNKWKREICSTTKRKEDYKYEMRVNMTFNVCNIIYGCGSFWTLFQSHCIGRTKSAKSNNKHSPNTLRKIGKWHSVAAFFLSKAIELNEILLKVGRSDENRKCNSNECVFIQKADFKQCQVKERKVHIFSAGLWLLLCHCRQEMFKMIYQVQSKSKNKIRKIIWGIDAWFVRK